MTTVDFRAKIRLQMFGTNDNTVLGDDYVDQMIEDAIVATGISDYTSVSLRYYVVYLIALNWDSVGALHSREGVTYVRPDPAKYLEIYNRSLGTSDGAYIAKVSTNVDFTVNTDNKVVRNA
jgi:hypothetical protein